MPWKHVGDARLEPSLHADALSISFFESGGRYTDKDQRYSVPVQNVRNTLNKRVASRLSRRYEAEDGTYIEIETGTMLRHSQSGLSVSFAIEGHIYAINACRLQEVLDGITIAAMIVERVDDAAQLSDETGTQATLGAF